MEQATMTKEEVLRKVFEVLNWSSDNIIQFQGCQSTLVPRLTELINEGNRKGEELRQVKEENHELRKRKRSLQREVITLKTQLEEETKVKGRLKRKLQFRAEFCKRKLLKLAESFAGDDTEREESEVRDIDDDEEEAEDSDEIQVIGGGGNPGLPALQEDQEDVEEEEDEDEDPETDGTRTLESDSEEDDDGDDNMGGAGAGSQAKAGGRDHSEQQGQGGGRSGHGHQRGGVGGAPPPPVGQNSRPAGRRTKPDGSSRQPPPAPTRYPNILSLNQQRPPIVPLVPQSTQAKANHGGGGGINPPPTAPTETRPRSISMARDLGQGPSPAVIQPPPPPIAVVTATERPGRLQPLLPPSGGGPSVNLAVPVEQFQFAAHCLSPELKLYFKQVTEGCLSSETGRSFIMMERLAADPPIAEILPHLVNFILKRVAENESARNWKTLCALMNMLLRLFKNANVTSRLARYMPEIRKSILGCIVNPAIGSEDSLKLQDKAVKTLVKSCTIPRDANLAEVHSVLEPILSHPEDSSLSSLHGAIEVVGALGEESIETDLIPNLRALGNYLESRLALSSVSEEDQAMAAKIEEGILNILGQIIVQTRRPPHRLKEYKVEFHYFGEKLHKLVVKLRRQQARLGVTYAEYVPRPDQCRSSGGSRYALRGLEQDSVYLI